MDLDGLRLLVVGASSGIGRAVGGLAGRSGARVALAARRMEPLTQARAEAGGEAVVIACDVTDARQCRDVVEASVDALGGLDAVVYAAGSSPLRLIGDCDEQLWSEVLATNLVGAALVAAASLPSLVATRGRLVLLGSSSVGRPYPGLTAYGCTKAALNELARGLRAEYPAVRTTLVSVGPTMTDFAAGWEPAIAGAMFERWQAEGYRMSAPMTATAMATEIVGVLASRARIDEISVMPDDGDA